jgi:hypothetical protein
MTFTSNVRIEEQVGEHLLSLREPVLHEIGVSLL